MPLTVQDNDVNPHQILATSSRPCHKIMFIAMCSSAGCFAAWDHSDSDQLFKINVPPMALKRSVRPKIYAFREKHLWINAMHSWSIRAFGLILVHLNLKCVCIFVLYKYFTSFYSTQFSDLSYFISYWLKFVTSCVNLFFDSFLQTTAWSY